MDQETEGNLLGWDIVGLCAHVNLLVDVDTGNDEEDSRSTSSACEKATQAEDDSPFIFLCKHFYISQEYFLF